MLKSVIAGLVIILFSFIRNSSTVCQSGNTILHSHLRCMKIVPLHNNRAAMLSEFYVSHFDMYAVVSHYGFIVQNLGPVISLSLSVYSPQLYAPATELLTIS